jgi:hypothetical protein
MELVQLQAADIEQLKAEINTLTRKSFHHAPEATQGH